jgi:hypothetical protein
MLQERRDEHERLKELNRRFLQEIESGKGWAEVKDLMEEMKQITKRLDNIPAQIVQFDAYPQGKKSGEIGK